MSSSSNMFSGVMLENQAGEQHDGSSITSDKILALYFAANWCPDCRNFQPDLNTFYNKVNLDSQQLEIIFIGSDNTESDQKQHFQEKQGPWWMIPYENKLRTTLKQKYGVCAGKEQESVGVKDRKAGIPSLIIIQEDGDLIDFNGVEAVENQDITKIEDWRKTNEE